MPELGVGFTALLQCRAGCFLTAKRMARMGLIDATKWATTCPFCKGEPETLEHFFSTCSFFDEQRKTFLDELIQEFGSELTVQEKTTLLLGGEVRGKAISNWHSLPEDEEADDAEADVQEYPTSTSDSSSSVASSSCSASSCSQSSPSFSFSSSCSSSSSDEEGREEGQGEEGWREDKLQSDKSEVADSDHSSPDNKDEDRISGYRVACVQVIKYLHACHSMRAPVLWAKRRRSSR